MFRLSNCSFVIVMYMIIYVFFCELVVNTWYNLPSNTEFSSLSAFKRFISNIDFSFYLKR